MCYPPPPPPLLSQERALEGLDPLSPSIACQYVRLVECLLGFPPNLDYLRYVCDHLLVSDLNEVKFVASHGLLETSISVFTGTMTGWVYST